MSEQPGTALEIHGALHDWYAILHVSGEFCHDARLRARLRDAMAALPMPDPPYLVLDLAGVASWDNWTIGAVLSSAKRVMTGGGALVIASAPADLLAHCRQIRLDRALRFRESVESAVEQLRSDA
ncbi:STAS domain-containing protein [Nonomuraea jabiensis]|uniref:Anti-anti-sigma regulatory factor n=1 Tax=Nonomuraea jabiensis TaxID=882448 RepID=A0A7W9G3Z6_9ACTN|nr:STAS domain-containing protein [Nonomuraea jabiensis]MBB5776724.1 anti-anti-sigma regulatory factor [Nonomuraea jabiensis]